MIIHRHVDVPGATIHCAIAGQGEPVLLLHQTPRSWDEYRDVLPLLAAHGQAIALDTPGFGASSALAAGEDSIERWADAIVAAADTLGLERFALVGHHTGAAIAVEIAATRPQRVTAAVLSACPLIDAQARARRAAAPPAVDHVVRHPDGSHLVELWRQRQPFYPPGDVDLLERFVADAIRAGPRAAGGHAVVGRYVMETRLPAIRCPVLVIAPTADPHAYPHARRLAGAILGSRYLEIEGGMVPLPDQMPQRFADAVSGFLRSDAAGARR